MILKILNENFAGRNQVGNYQSIPYQGGGAASYRGVAGPLPPPAPPLIYAPYYG